MRREGKRKERREERREGEKGRGREGGKEKKEGGKMDTKACLLKKLSEISTDTTIDLLAKL